MVDSNTLDSPLEAAAGAAGTHATDAFELLGNETRLTILLALWEAYEPTEGETALSFTELRDRVGVRQGGQFNYHLEKLVGEFVEKTDAGYELERTGRILVQSIIAGTGITEPTLEPAEINAPCKFCGASTAITYDQGYVYQLCPDCPDEGDSESDHPSGMLVGWTFEPTGLAGRTHEEIFTASTVKNFGRIAMRFEDVCPVCSGRVEWSLDVCEDHNPGDDGLCPTCGRDHAVLAREVCSVCKSSGRGSPGIKVLFHPAVVSFFYDRGVEVGFAGDTDFADVVRTLELVETFAEEVVSTDPLRVRVTVPYEGDELRLLLDEKLTVIDVSEDTRPHQ